MKTLVHLFFFVSFKVVLSQLFPPTSPPVLAATSPRFTRLEKNFFLLPTATTTTTLSLPANFVGKVFAGSARRVCLRGSFVCVGVSAAVQTEHKWVLQDFSSFPSSFKTLPPHPTLSLQTGWVELVLKVFSLCQLFVFFLLLLNFAFQLTFLLSR